MFAAILMGSDSDLDQVQPCLAVLRDLGIPFAARVLSAHRTPEALHAFVHENDDKVSVYICAAGGAAHLAGVVAALTLRPVIGIPIAGASLAGADSLYSMVQMPGGVPVAVMGIGSAGAKNAGLFTAALLALSDAALKSRLAAFRLKQAEEVAVKDRKLQERLRGEGFK